MFVRWQHYYSQAKRSRDDGPMRLKAILVESVRIDGKPRQKHITCLGSIASRNIGGDVPMFWYGVSAKLKSLDNRIGLQDYERITASIAEKVGGRPMTGPEIEEFERKRELFLKGMALPAHRRTPRRPRRKPRTLSERIAELTLRLANQEYERSLK